MRNDQVAVRHIRIRTNVLMLNASVEKKNEVIEKNIKFAMSLHYIQEKSDATFFISNINIEINKHFN